MRIFVNAIALRAAGGRSVALNFLRAVAASDSTDTYYVVAPAGCGYEELDAASVRIKPLPRGAANPLARPFIDRIWLPQMVASVRPDVIFSMGNLPVLTMRAPQLVLFHWPYAIYPESPVWERMDLRSRWMRQMRLRAFERGLPYASAIAAQTPTAKRRLEKLYGVSNVHVVPNAVSLPTSRDSHTPKSAFVRHSPHERWLLCLTRYYPHKNIEVLLDVARMIRDRGQPFRFLFTVDGSQHSGAARFLRRVSEEGLGSIIHNIGAVPMNAVPALYEAVDGMILPTLLESFSGTYVESMHYRVPIFTSDLDFARDVCGNAAFYFDPLDPASIHDAIHRAFSDDEAIRAVVADGSRAVARMPDWNAVAAAYVQVLSRVAHGQLFAV